MRFGCDKSIVEFMHENIVTFYCIFKKINLMNACPFMGLLTPLVLTSGHICSGFQTRVDNLIHTLREHM